MPLILAVESDCRQASQLATLLQRVRAELVLAETAARALEVLDDRVPDVLLTSALLSWHDEAALGARLRELGPAAAHVQALTIPILATPAPDAPRRGVLSVLKRRPRATTTDGCEPEVFAEQVALYLGRAAAECQGGHVADLDSPADAPLAAVAGGLQPSGEVAADAPVALPAEDTTASVENMTVSADVRRPEGPRLPDHDEIPAHASIAAPADDTPLAAVAGGLQPSGEIAADAPAEPVEDTTASVEDMTVSADVRRPEGLRLPEDDEITADAPIAEPVEHATASVLDMTMSADVWRPENVQLPEDVEADDDEPWITLPLDNLCTPAAASPIAPSSTIDEVWVLTPVGALDALVGGRPAPSPPIAPAAPPQPESMPPAAAATAAPAGEIPPPIAPVQPGRQKTPRPKNTRKPVQDEWGFFDPEQCGFAALLAKLDEITEQDGAEKPGDTTIRVIGC